MCPKLPASAERKLQQTLSQWQQWRCEPRLASKPVVLRRLGDGLNTGLSNYSSLVAASERQYVVRIDGDRVAANGLNRPLEWRALAQAHAAGIAPCPRYFNPALSSLVCDYLPPDPQQPLTAQDVAELLRGVHALPPRRQRLDLAARIARYEHQLRAGDRATEECKKLLYLGEQITPLVRLLAHTNAPDVLCHNDLLAANRLYSRGKLYALDWEYCAMGSAWYDLAVVIHGDNLNSTAADELVGTYLQREPTKKERQILARYGSIYRYLELLWFSARAGGDVDMQRLDALRSSLVAL